MSSPVPDSAAPEAAAPGQVMCSAGELRGLFLFEKLTDDQLAWLCREGRVVVTEPGLVYAEGEPAALLYVLLSGTVVLSRRIGTDDVETTRASNPGVYAGAFFAYMGDRVPQVYNNSMRVTERSRFFTLEAAKFAKLMTEWFPMAVHLLEGLFFGTQEHPGGHRPARTAAGPRRAFSRADPRTEQPRRGRGSRHRGPAGASLPGCGMCCRKWPAGTTTPPS